MLELLQKPRSPYTFLMTDWSIAISDSFLNFLVFTQNQKTDFHTLQAVIGQLCGGEKNKQDVNSDYFCHFSLEQTSKTLWTSSQRDCLKMCPDHNNKAELMFI